MPQTGHPAPSRSSIPPATSTPSSSLAPPLSSTTSAAVGTTPTLGLTFPQVVGSALAAVTGAFCAGWLGVAGTIAGAAVGSVIGTVGSASYTYSLQRGHAVVRRGERLTDRTPRLPWTRLALGTAVVLLLGLATLTLVEGMTGRPVSSLTSGSGTGTTLGQILSPSGGDGSDTVDPAGGPTQQPSDGPTTEPSPAGGSEPPAADPSVDPGAEPTPTPTDPASPTAPTPTP